MIERSFVRRIIQTGQSRQLTLGERGFVSNVKLLNPGFEYRYFDDEEVEAFIDSEYPQYRSVFDGFQFKIQKIDFFRYLAIFHYGGFYLDLDVLLASSLEPLIHTECVFPFECLAVCEHYPGMDWQIGNYAFGAASGHPFLAAVIENCVRAQRDPNWVTPMMRGVPYISRAEFYVLNSTGPGLVSRTLAENPDVAASVTVLMPDDVCDSASWYRFGDYGLHFMGGSWRKKRGAVSRRIANYFESRLSRRVRSKSLEQGASRRTPITRAWSEGSLEAPT